MTSNHHAPYAQGYTRATMGGTEGCQTVRWSQSLKAILSSDCRLKLAYMKLELLVIADQNAAVNAFPGLVHTARHTTGVGNTRSRLSNRKEEVVEGGVDNWGEVVTRQPYRKVRLDHLLSKENYLLFNFEGSLETSKDCTLKTEYQ